MLHGAKRPSASRPRAAAFAFAPAHACAAACRLPAGGRGGRGRERDGRGEGPAARAGGRRAHATADRAALAGRDRFAKFTLTIDLDVEVPEGGPFPVCAVERADFAGGDARVAQALACLPAQVKGVRPGGDTKEEVYRLM